MLTAGRTQKPRQTLVQTYLFTGSRDTIHEGLLELNLIS